MFELFEDEFTVTGRVDVVSSGNEGALSVFRARYGGSTFNNGLYRAHTTESAAASAVRVAEAFAWRGDFACFAFDWLGREFAVNLSNLRLNDPPVLLFEPGTGEVLEIPVPFSEFHDDELVNYGDAALARGFFQAWREATNVDLRFSQCAGYRIPLFLSGTDTVDNLEVSDRDVYWEIMGQLRSGAMAQRAGTPIDGVSRAD
jgi:hypothetical protein